MNKKKREPMNWKVLWFDVNAQEITEYDVLKYREDDIKKWKKEYKTKEEFTKKLGKEMMYQYWSRSEYELVIEITDDGRIWLNPWCGCRDPEKVRIDVTDRTDLDWVDFAEVYIKRQVFNNKAKISIYDQLIYKWDNFVDYCWNYRHKWQRSKNGR